MDKADFDYGTYIEAIRESSAGVSDARLRARAEGLSEDLHLEAEIVAEETLERFTSEIDTWLRAGLLSGTPDSAKIEYATRGELVGHFVEFVKRFTENSAVLELEKNVVVRLADLADNQRDEVLTQLFTEFAYTSRLFSQRLSQLASKPTTEFLLRESPAVFSEVRKGYPELSEREIAKRFKARPTAPISVESSFGYSKSSQKDSAPEKGKPKTIAAQELLRELEKPRGKQVFYFLPGDLERFDEELESLNEEYRAVQNDMKLSVEQTSESWHDNFGFEQGTRDLGMVEGRRNRARDVRKGAVIANPDLQRSEVNIGMRVTVLDGLTGLEEDYTIGGYFAAEQSTSYQAPLARLLLGAQVGDTVEGEVGQKIRRLKITKIEPTNQ